jgi:uncharacterized LabA/DUF88 family protein
MNRAIFLVDGFNLYHSIISLQRVTNIKAKWLNINSLCTSYLHLLGKSATLEKIYYFSSIPNYLSNYAPDKIIRHNLYIKCLEDSGVCVELGRFKKKDTYCPLCKGTFIKHEEKETDVAIGARAIEILHSNLCEIVVVVSGDTDLIPIINTGKSLFKDKKIVFCFPFQRAPQELKNIAPGSFSISKNQYINHQFANPLILKSGETISKPKTW